MMPRLKFADVTKRFAGQRGGVVTAVEDVSLSVADGEVVSLDEDGRRSFNTLQNSVAPLHFFIFDLLVLKGKEVMGDPLMKRRELIEEHVLPRLAEPVRYSPILDAALRALIQSVKEQGLEGLVAKRADGKYEPGLRSGSWQKMRVNQGHDFVIAGYTPSSKTFDSLVIGYDEGDRPMYAARTRNGSRRPRGPNCSRRSSRWNLRNAHLRTSPRKRRDAGARG